jgi:hypothetical protein
MSAGYAYIPEEFEKNDKLDAKTACAQNGL